MISVFALFIIAASVQAKQSSDLYVFAYSWTPEFCEGESYPLCSTPEDFWGTHFTLHGLWPQFSSGGYPADCSTEVLNSTVFDEIGMDTMNQYWPNVPKSYNDPD